MYQLTYWRRPFAGSASGGMRWWPDVRHRRWGRSRPMPITSALAVGIFGGSLALLLLRHRRVPDCSAALGGGVLMVVVGVLPLGDALSQLAASWNVFLFFLGLGLSVASALVIVGAGSFITLQAGAQGF